MVFGPFDNAHGQSILDGPTGIFALELAIHLRTTLWYQLVQLDNGRPANRLENAILVDSTPGTPLQDGEDRRWWSFRLVVVVRAHACVRGSGGGSITG